MKLFTIKHEMLDEPTHCYVCNRGFRPDEKTYYVFDRKNGRTMGGGHYCGDCLFPRLQDRDDKKTGKKKEYVCTKCRAHGFSGFLEPPTEVCGYRFYDGRECDSTSYREMELDEIA